MEKLMQYVWGHRLMLRTDMLTVDGRKVQIIDPGLPNTGPGPDFSNAKICIQGQHWAGDVEMHVRASDWHRHHHDGDTAYDSVILHVVDQNDTAICRGNGETIPQMVMQCAPDFHDRYQELVQRADIDLPCADHIRKLDPIYVRDWLTALAFERVYGKVERVNQVLEDACGDWEQAFYVTLARGLGFGRNAEPMERLARSLPLQFLRKHSDSPRAVESLLFGQSGLLNDTPVDDYALALKSDFVFYRHKFSLAPAQGLNLRSARPQNSPHRRVGLLAAYVAEGGGRMFSRAMEVANIDQAMSLFQVAPSDYWEGHYNFGIPAPRQSRPGVGRAATFLLVINVLVPLMVAHGMATGDEAQTQRAFELLHQVPAERNSIVSMFGCAGIDAHDAFTSQAVIQLRRAYCEQRKCLYCRLGRILLAQRAKRV